MSRRDVKSAVRTDDAGVTLVELIVYVIVAGVILAGIAGLFVNAWISQTQTTNRDVATGEAAVVGASLSQSIRNASEFEVMDSGRTVVAVVAVDSAKGWECRAWSVTNDGAVVYKASPESFSVSDTTGWATLATGATGTLAGDVPFNPIDSNQLEIGLTITTNEQAVPITNGVTVNAKIREGGGPCW